MEFKNEVFDRFSTLFRKIKNQKIKKSDLLREQEDLLQQLELQKKVIDDLKKALADTKDELELERWKCYQEGVRRGRDLASKEEKGVLEELQILKEITATLKSDKNGN